MGAIELVPLRVPIQGVPLKSPFVRSPLVVPLEVPLTSLCSGSLGGSPFGVPLNCPIDGSHFVGRLGGALVESPWVVLLMGVPFTLSP
jgi:hypothetical protein